MIMAGYLGVDVVRDGKYYFVSYNTEDMDRVAEYVKTMAGMGLPIWYDYGIAVGSEWSTTIANRIRDCEAVILFLSRNIFEKEQSFVHKEFEMARDYFDKKIYVVILDDIKKSEVPLRYISWWIDITHLQCIMAPQFTVNECAKNVLSAVGFEAEVAPLISEENDDDEDGDDEDALMELFDLINDTIIEENRAEEQVFMKNAVVKDGTLIKYTGTDSHVRIHEGITSIGRRAFANNQNLVGIEIPDSLTEIEEYAFDNCQRLMEVDIPEGVRSIGEHAFLYCTSLKKVTIPYTVEYIGGYAFAYCESLGDIVYRGTDSEWDNIEWGERIAQKAGIITLECTDRVVHNYLFIRY